MPNDIKAESDPQVRCDDWLGGWNDVKTITPPLRDWVSGRGWSDKEYVLAVDAKGRMSIGFATTHSSVPFIWTFAKPIGEPTHWRQLPKPPNDPSSATPKGPR